MNDLAAAVAVVVLGLLAGLADADCASEHCSAEGSACLTDADCTAALGCLARCDGWHPQCPYGCGLMGNEKMDAMFQCQADNGCFPTPPPTSGRCLATHDQGVDRLVANQGRWWQLKGLNCNQSAEWIGGFDNFPCASSLSTYDPDHQSLQGTSSFCYGNGTEGRCDTPMINFPFWSTIPTRGYLHTEMLKTTGIITPQHVDTVVISNPDPDWMLAVSCGSSPTFAYNGASVMSTKTSLSEMPDSVKAEFQAAAARHGFDFDQMCAKDVQHCQP